MTNVAPIIRPPVGRFAVLPTSDLKPHPRNPRKHNRKQIEILARSIKAFGFNAPILIDKDKQMVAGHCRRDAAKSLGLLEVPVVFLEHLSPAQIDAYLLADNKIADLSSWDDSLLANELKKLSELALTFNFDIEATGFELAEIDFHIQSLDESRSTEAADEFDIASGPAISALGDVWEAGPHKICCGSALEPRSYDLLECAKAAAAFTDPPYNVPIDGHTGGKGKITHREFPMASGEMSEAEFTSFLTTSLGHICAHTSPGALLYLFMDWRHLAELFAAGKASQCDLLNMCVWVKTNGGLGSLYRSRHELVFVFKNGKEPHVNNVQLGRFGRNRTNVWNYAGANAFGREDLKLHPTVKPVRLVADAILDSTRRNDIVLDPFLGSGTTLLAAEKTGRRCYGIELDPLYVDTAVERWQQMTGGKAHSRLGETYDQIKARRRAKP